MENKNTDQGPESSKEEKPKTTRELIDEKYRLSAERSKVIQQEIERAKAFKRDIENRFGNKD